MQGKEIPRQRWYTFHSLTDSELRELSRVLVGINCTHEFCEEKNVLFCFISNPFVSLQISKQIPLEGLRKLKMYVLKIESNYSNFNFLWNVFISITKVLIT